MKIKLKQLGLIAVLILHLTACDSDNLSHEMQKELPVAVQHDFKQRYGNALISFCNNYSEGIQEIKFTDKMNNLISAFYKDDKWKLSITKFESFKKLPVEIQLSFKSSPYADAKIEEIERIERCEFSHTLYRFYFQFPRKGSIGVVHEVLMNEDGLLIQTFNYQLNNQRWFVGLEKEQLAFITEHYIDADIRAYLNDLGYDSYYFIENKQLKQISFDNDNKWKETRYELSEDTKLPDNILLWLQKNDAEFNYTKIVYIESPSGNAYLLVDEKSENDKGYIIGEHIP